MANNGLGTRQEAVQARLQQKWSGVLDTLKKVIVPEKPPEPTKEEIQERVLATWAAEAPAEVITWLTGFIRIAADQRADAVDSHGKLAYFNGLEDAFTVVRAKFLAWRGQGR